MLVMMLYVFVCRNSNAVFDCFVYLLFAVFGVLMF